MNQPNTVWLFRERAGHEETLIITFGSKPTAKQLAEALTTSRNRHAWLEEDVALVTEELKTLVAHGYEELWITGEHSIEWDLRELENEGST